MKNEDPGGGDKPWREDVSLLCKHFARKERIPEHTEAVHCSSEEERLLVSVRRSSDHWSQWKFFSRLQHKACIAVNALTTCDLACLSKSGRWKGGLPVTLGLLLAEHLLSKIRCPGAAGGSLDTFWTWGLWEPQAWALHFSTVTAHIKEEKSTPEISGQEGKNR